MYKYDLHVHSSGCSACGVDDIYKIVCGAKEAGLSGIALTNHFWGGNSRVDRTLDWADFVKQYETEYIKAKEYGEKIGVKVFWGIEEGVGRGKEALIYGVKPYMIGEHPELKMAGIAALSKFVHDCNGLIYAAHPFRDRAYIEDPLEKPDMKYYDGIEVYNTGNSDLDNKLADNFAKATGCNVIAGGDVHYAHGFKCCGLATEFPIKNDEHLIDVLKNRRYRLLINNEII